MPPIAAPKTSATDHAVCLGCGCLCDDIGAEVVDGQLTALRQACTLGEAWYRQPRGHDSQTAAFIDGKPATFAVAVQHAAELLRNARYPLVCGLSAKSCAAQSLATAIADRLAGAIDSTTPDDAGATVLALQQVGQVSCTLGEVRQRLPRARPLPL